MSYYIVLKAIGITLGVIAFVFIVVKYAYLYMKNTLIIVGALTFTACLGYDVYKIYFVKDNATIAKDIKKTVDKETKRKESPQDLHKYVLDNTYFKDYSVNYDVVPEIDMAMVMVINAYRSIQENMEYKPTITSAKDFNGHKDNSYHYKGKAVDVRIKDVKENKRNDLVTIIRLTLGPTFTVLHEDKGVMNEHLHIQLKESSNPDVATNFDGII